MSSTPPATTSGPLSPRRGADKPEQRVVVTGLGTVCGWGAGVDALWQGLLGAGTAIAPFRRFDAARYRTRLAAEVPGELGDGAPRARCKGGAARERLSLADRFALAAAGEAAAQAGLAPPEDTRGAGVFFGSSTGGMWESERYFAHLIGVREGRPRLGWVTSQQYNGPGDAVARWARVEGPVETLSSACTSGALAIAAAADALRDGEAELALAGGSDSLCQLTYAGFNSLRAVDAAPCRPFRRDREGMSLGEGAAVLVLETLAHARRRGARPLAELLAGASSCDAHHMTAPAPDGRGAVCAIRRALGEAGIAADAVDFVNAHGTGTPLNDTAEWQALLQTLGARAADVPVAAPKGSVGHLLGAAGALEAVATVLCLTHGCVHPTPAGGEVDEAAPAPLVLGRALRNGQLDVGLSINLAFGGSNAALLFARWDEAA
ncbi:MAG TPA: beta-ketoacyl-[acyl-carrier-protein] synthase family protein [Thermoanaerobaculia bacterium]|nr:beta-ketoacyl-[acyl-carrier-protein] synthase family protein [Thermoanaerobaculia bacterium]